MDPGQSKWLSRATVHALVYAQNGLQGFLIPRIEEVIRAPVFPINKILTVGVNPFRDDSTTKWRIRNEIIISIINTVLGLEVDRYETLAARYYCAPLHGDMDGMDEVTMTLPFPSQKKVGKVRLQLSEEGFHEWVDRGTLIVLFKEDGPWSQKLTKIIEDNKRPAVLLCESFDDEAARRIIEEKYTSTPWYEHDLPQEGTGEVVLGKLTLYLRKLQ